MHCTHPQASGGGANGSRVRQAESLAHRHPRTQCPSTPTASNTSAHTALTHNSNSHTQQSSNQARRIKGSKLRAGTYEHMFCGRESSAGGGRMQELRSPDRRDRGDMRPREEAELQLAMEHPPGLSARGRLFRSLTHAARCAGGWRNTVGGRGRRSGRSAGRWPQVGAWASTRCFGHPRRRPASRASQRGCP